MGKKFTFRGKVKADRERRKSRGSFVPDYLNLGDIPLFIIRPDKDAPDEEDIVEVVLDILPYPVTDENHLDEAPVSDPEDLSTWWIKKPYRLHRDIGADDKLVICPTTFGESCPVCAYAKMEERKGVEYNELRPFFYTTRNLYVVVPRSVKGRKDLEFEAVPHIWDVSYGIFQKKLDKELELNPDYEAVFDPEDGYSIKLRFGKTSGGNFKYMDIDRIDFVKRENDIPVEMLESVPELDNCLVKTSPEELSKIFKSDPFLVNGEEDEPEPQPDGDVPDEVFDNTGEEEVHEEDEETPEEQPKTRTRRRLSK